MSKHIIRSGAALCLLSALSSCGEPPDEGAPGENAPSEPIQQAATTAHIKYVFVVAMENTDASQIYGNTTDAPYINGTVIPNYGRATNFGDELALSIPSEPHYVWMEAGANSFSDHTFSNDDPPSSTNSTGSTQHLVTQIKNASNGVTWRAYQEGIDGTSGACPIASSGFYQPKHNPFVFFRDVSGNPPSKSNSYCVAHTRALGALAGDLGNVAVASYNFITPNQCHDMHGQSGCPNSNRIRAGDDWLEANLPPLISFCNAHSGVIMITWDEGSSSSKMAFLVVGPNVKKGYTSTLSYNHSSIIKAAERILQLPYLSTSSAANGLADFYSTGYP